MSPPRKGSIESAFGRLAELARIAAAAGHSQLSAELDRAAATLRRRELTVAVLGQFKRGKSSLLNAFTGWSALPTGILPTTAVPTYVVRGAAAARVADGDGGVRAVPIESIAEYVSEQLNPGNARGVASVEVSVPMPDWTEGLRFVDSPGVGSVHEANTAAARALLPTVDAAVFVLSPDPPITADELSFLREASTYAAKFFFVINKIDLVPPSERPTLLRYLEDTLRDRCGFPSARIFMTSARAAFDGLPGRVPVGRASSGVLELWEALRAFLGADRDAFVHEVVDARVRRFSRQLRGLIDLALRAAAASRDESAQHLASLKGAILELRTEHRATQAMLTEEVAELVRQLPTLIGGARRGRDERVVAALEPRLNAVTARTAGGLVAAFEDEFRARVQPEVAGVREAVTGEIRERLLAWNRVFAARLRRGTDQLHAVVEAEFGVRLPPISVEGGLAESMRYSDRVSGLFEDTFAGQTVLFLPSGVLRGRLRRRLPEIVGAEFEAQCGRLRSDLADRVLQSWDAIRRRVEEQLEREVAVIDEATAQGRATVDLGTKASEQWRGEMEGLLSRVAEVQASGHAGDVAA